MVLERCFLHPNQLTFLSLFSISSYILRAPVPFKKNHDLASFQLILDIKTQLSQSIVSESKNISNIVIVVP